MEEVSLTSILLSLVCNSMVFRVRACVGDVVGGRVGADNSDGVGQVGGRVRLGVGIGLVGVVIVLG